MFSNGWRTPRLKGDTQGKPARPLGLNTSESQENSECNQNLDFQQAPLLVPHGCDTDQFATPLFILLSCLSCRSCTTKAGSLWWMVNHQDGVELILRHRGLSHREPCRPENCSQPMDYSETLGAKGMEPGQTKQHIQLRNRIPDWMDPRLGILVWDNLQSKAESTN